MIVFEVVGEVFLYGFVECFEVVWCVVEVSDCFFEVCCVEVGDILVKGIEGKVCFVDVVEMFGDVVEVGVFDVVECLLGFVLFVEECCVIFGVV